MYHCVIIWQVGEVHAYDELSEVWTRSEYKEQL